MPLSTILSLLLAALLVFVLVGFTLRARQALAATREAQRFRQQMAALAAGVEPALAQLTARTDAARRGLLPPGELVEDLDRAEALLEQAQGALGDLPVPAYGRALREAMAGDVERAARAVEAIRHGCDLAVNGDSRQRELEAQTAVKRGYLNLLHAREALTSHAADAARVAAGRPGGWRTSRI